jgi:hypothetical protein
LRLMPSRHEEPPAGVGFDIALLASKARFPHWFGAVVLLWRCCAATVALPCRCGAAASLWRRCGAVEALMWWYCGAAAARLRRYCGGAVAVPWRCCRAAMALLYCRWGDTEASGALPKRCCGAVVACCRPLGPVVASVSQVAWLLVCLLIVGLPVGSVGLGAFLFVFVSVDLGPSGWACGLC